MFTVKSEAGLTRPDKKPYKGATLVFTPNPSKFVTADKVITFGKGKVELDDLGKFSIDLNWAIGLQYYVTLAGTGASDFIPFWFTAPEDGAVRDLADITPAPAPVGADPHLYFKGDDGEPGPKGDDGDPGPKGDPGTGDDAFVAALVSDTESATRTSLDSTFVALALVGAPTGVAPLDAAGKVPAENLPASSGGTVAVDSVNGQTGAVILTASDVGADPAGAAAAVQAMIPTTPADIGAATSAQGAKADSAVQPGSLATVATTGAYGDLTGRPTLGTAAATAATDYATAAQGSRADSAVQPGGLAIVATTGAYGDLSGKPTLGTAAATASTDYATSAQGAKADTALQPATGQAINAQTGTAYTLVAADAGKLLTLNNAAAITLTVPPNVFTTGQRVDVLALGAGMVTAAAGSGATVNGTPSLTSRARYSAFTVIFTSPTSAVVVGDLA